MGCSYEHILYFPSVYSASTPNKFNGQAAVPAWCIWLGAAFCFLVANFMAWRREVRRAETAESKLHEISHATPRMKLKEPNPVYCETITQTFTAVPSGQIVKQRQDTFLKIRFVNDPRLSVPSSKATVIATIDYYSDPDNIHLHSLDGRWADSTQPSAISPLESKIHLLPATFLHRQQRSLDIAFCDGESGKYYAWNNDNYNAGNEFYVYPKHLLVGLRFRVAIRLRGDWVDKKVSCIFGTKDKGFVIESYEEE